MINHAPHLQPALEWVLICVCSISCHVSSVIVLIVLSLCTCRRACTVQVVTPYKQSPLRAQPALLIWIASVGRLQPALLSCDCLGRAGAGLGIAYYVVAPIFSKGRYAAHDSRMYQKELFTSHIFSLSILQCVHKAKLSCHPRPMYPD